MINLSKGRYRARMAGDRADRDGIERLRFRAFFGGEGADADRFDDEYAHVLVEEIETGELVCCFRLRLFADGSEINESYSAQFYDLSALDAFPAPMIELGRFCIHPDHTHPDILRVAWGGVTSLVDRSGVEMMFGCVSFRGTDVTRYADAFALLHKAHLAPARWMPKAKAPQIVTFSAIASKPFDIGKARASMPSLLRTYLSMGGWVSDHAVIDAEMDTIHVFTSVETRAVPPVRARLLRQLAS